MKVLITSSRMPFALDEVRKFGSSGHEVYAADTFGSAPGNHSKYVTEYFVLDSPRDETSAYVEQLRDIVVTRRIELVVPAFEEAFYIAKHRDAFRDITTLFIPPFEVLALLHDKASFTRFAEELGVAVPATTVATNARELDDASIEYPEYFARPAFSRGGVRVLTNTGPLAGMLSFADADPTPKNPWIVQEFVRGRDVCSFSVVRSGRVVAHAVYVHPKTIEHAAGIVFESIDEPRTLDIDRKSVV